MGDDKKKLKGIPEKQEKKVKDKTKKKRPKKKPTIAKPISSSKKDALSKVKKMIQEVIVEWKGIKKNEDKLYFMNKVINTKTYGGLLKVINSLQSKGLDLIDIKEIITDLSSNDCYTKSNIKSNILPKFIIDGLLIKTQSMYPKSNGVVTVTYDKLNTWDILKRTCSFIHDRTKRLMFFIPPANELKGRILQKISRTRKDVELIFEVLKIDDSKKGIHTSAIFFIGDSPDKRAWRRSGETLDYKSYIYDFQTDNNERMLLFYHKDLEMGEYILKGIKLNLKDFYLVGDSKRIHVTLPVFIPHSNFIKDFKVVFSKEEFESFVKEKGFKGISDFMFKNFRHPQWFEDLVLADLFSAEYDGYPLNFFIIGVGDSGKSSLLENIYSCYDEPQEIISGEQSTFKALIPSFALNPPDVGGFCKCKRVCVVDEFFRMVSRNVRHDDRSVTALGSLNTLLEHKKRLAMSGKGSLSVNPTARGVFASNPMYKGSDMVSLLERLKNDIPFITRFLLYFQTKQHTDFVDKRKEIVQDGFKISFSVNEYLGFIDYLNELVVVDKKASQKVKEVFNEIIESLNPSLRDVFRSRYMHHLVCLLDGLVKVRCLKNNVFDFKPIQEDYDYLKVMMLIIVNSWSPDSLDNLPHKIQLEYVSYKARRIFDVIKLNKGMLESEFSNVFDDIGQPMRYVHELEKLDLVFFYERTGKWYPYHMKEFIDNVKAEQFRKDGGEVT